MIKTRTIITSMLLMSSIVFGMPTLTKIEQSAIEVITHSNQIEGLKNDQFNLLKPGLIEYVQKLVEKGAIVREGSDEEIRPYFVSLQAILEHVLANNLQGEIQNLVGVIHTPMPATPLCTKADSLEPKLVDPKIENDPKRLLTVQSRAVILRKYLEKGGRLYAAYPESGLAKRTAAQQAIYKEELSKYKDVLIDMPLSCEAIDPEIIGASYFFQDSSGQTYAFLIKMTQANSPEAKGKYGLWFGPIDSPEINKKIKTTFAFLDKFGKEKALLPNIVR